MSNAALKRRIAVLEETVARLLPGSMLPPVAKNWRSTIGMFPGDSVMKEIDEEGRKIREAEREQAKRDHS
jgi:hypothetical protein